MLAFKCMLNPSKMTVQEFFSAVDAVRFDPDAEAGNMAEIKSLAGYYYPKMRKLYNLMLEEGLITED